MDELREREAIQEARLGMFRSDIYIRDNAICWVCNRHVELRDYDLGHLIDRCNGGQDDYDNLAVMHKKCNLKKPRHITLDEAMRWKLTPKYLTVRPTRPDTNSQLKLKDLTGDTPQTDNKTTPQPNWVFTPRRQESLAFARHVKSDLIEIGKQHIDSHIAAQTELIQNDETHIAPVLEPPLPKIQRRIQRLHVKPSDIETIKQLVVEYFHNRPELLQIGHKTDRAEAIRQLSSTLQCPVQYIRRYMVEAELVKPARKQHTDGSQYREVYDKLPELIAQYDTGVLIGLPFYAQRIMLYLAGRFDRVDRKSQISIGRKIRKLHLDIRRM
jgi:hypothetical protein